MLKPARAPALISARPIKRGTSKDR